MRDLQETHDSVMKEKQIRCLYYQLRCGTEGVAKENSVPYVEKYARHDQCIADWREALSPLRLNIERLCG